MSDVLARRIQELLRRRLGDVGIAPDRHNDDLAIAAIGRELNIGREQIERELGQMRRQVARELRVDPAGPGAHLPTWRAADQEPSRRREPDDTEIERHQAQS